MHLIAQQGIITNWVKEVTHISGLLHITWVYIFINLLEICTDEVNQLLLDLHSPCCTASHKEGLLDSGAKFHYKILLVVIYVQLISYINKFFLSSLFCVSAN